MFDRGRGDDRHFTWKWQRREESGIGAGGGGGITRAGKCDADLAGDRWGGRSHRRGGGGGDGGTFQRGKGWGWTRQAICPGMTRITTSSHWAT
ncbi:MAG: hypothetical protein MZV64_60480 [Ignavibacteriales bacterium]|nr:hypothetical protein [Ignavibacteriales bacterium]